MYNYCINAPSGFDADFIHLQATDIGLCTLAFVNEKKEPVKSNRLISEAISALENYFAGQGKIFRLKLDVIGTDFQKKVWSELQKILFGETWSYKQLALAIGSANYCRAVGAANGKNPISIIVPCHRVIGSDQRLVRYAGGLKTKQWLLEHEKKIWQAD
ncbi:O-6-alkylguanine-DNA:cysteine-protein methyltransferase [Candidatus Regiella insecticola LSR1]|uniref:Methylated-DNA--protein-cysteine methyltransferase n=1 Tax=Candidatus Regiella insecticola LSR1 TaxID=663321 RepID=E0WUL4_9ENTR|nr:methylated-DNA--[protein]-cysteine S-methyltransferase [Candidatus Regiella insecticola]EFL91302.1 O-6-alkylguanine-DNA:cysteine-protein methyltransferase [Candidatus Regiella insecticola LSR1]